MTFLEYLTLLQRRWRVWVSTIVIGLLAAGAVSFLADEQYVAVSTLFVTVADEEAAGAGESFQGSQFVTQRMVSYSALSSSPTVVEAVIEELELDVSPRELRQMLDVSSPTGTVMLEVSVEHTDPERAAAISDEVSTQLGLLIEELETPRGLAASSVEAVLTHPAAVPTEPSSPRVRLNLLLGLAVGAAAGVLLSLLREHVDRRLRSAADVRAVSGVRHLGSTVSRARDTPLVATDQRSPDVEPYRNVKTALKVAHPNIHHFVVASPAEGAGAAVETANLALAWALGGAKVCVVDAALRRPAVAEVFDVPDRHGLSDVLAGELELDTALGWWDEGTVAVLPAGPTPPDPAELLGSKAMSLLVAELRSRFDVVLYHAGPLLEGADAVVLARALDGVLLVVRARTTTRDELADCLRLMDEARVPVLGTVLSGLRTRRQARRSGHHGREPDAPAGQSRRTELSPSI